MISTYNPTVICLQETWLYSFQNKKIEELFPEYDYCARSVDDDDESPQSELVEAVEYQSMDESRKVELVCVCHAES